MRLFHVSEESDIAVFEPRLPHRSDLNPSIGLVWAIDEAHLPNFLTPRDCPRVTYHIGRCTTEEDIQRFFSSPTASHAVILENKWFCRMRDTSLYLYEFDPAGFVLQDETAGYYVAKTPQTPIARHKIEDLFAALFERSIEVRLVDNLWSICKEVQQSGLDWSMCRMCNAQAPMGEAKQ